MNDPNDPRQRLERTTQQNSELERLRAEVERLTKELLPYRQAEEMGNPSYGDLRTEVERLKELYADSGRDLEDAVETREQIRLQVAALESDNAALKLRVEDLEKALQCEVNERDYIQSELDSAVKSHIQHAASIEAKLADAMDALGKIRNSESDADYRSNPAYAATTLQRLNSQP